MKKTDLTTNTDLISYDYDAFQRLEIDHLLGENSRIKATTTYGYDFDGQLLSKKTAGVGVSYCEEYAYEEVFHGGLYREVKKVLGDVSAPDIVTTSYKDALGQIVAEGYFVGGREYNDTYTYDKQGNQLTVLTARDQEAGNTYSVRRVFDGLGQVSQETDTNGSTSQFKYDVLGNITISTDKKGARTDYGYDTAGKMVRKQKSERNLETYSYDGAGNLLKLTTPSNANSDKSGTNYSYDLRNRVTKAVSQDETDETQYEYDAVGNKTTVYTGVPKGNLSYALKTSYTYNQLGKVLTEINPEGQVQYFYYDKTGLLTSTKDHSGNSTTFVYDNMNRMINELPRSKTTGYQWHTAHLLKQR